MNVDDIGWHTPLERTWKFAEKNNLPKLEYVSLPRAGAMQVIMEEIGPNQDAFDVIDARSRDNVTG
ncbi:1-acylglycerol-3-phosphate acyltransferase [Operophtera brumata]|uniref:1-acylglycerol-3-phosphate acyltransferase n=1 Tax=Operophtera brumata TaxID=104452 RepID=A0A0L7LAN1_OPEBR|nr:1-acylglycerol-3-phosphate acyltransferase [Operophtera brumata]